MCEAREHGAEIVVSARRRLEERERIVQHFARAPMRSLKSRGNLRGTGWRSLTAFLDSLVSMAGAWETWRRWHRDPRGSTRFQFSVLEGRGGDVNDWRGSRVGLSEVLVSAEHEGMHDFTGDSARGRGILAMEVSDEPRCVNVVCR